MNQYQLESLITKLLVGDKTAHAELIKYGWREQYTYENAEYILAATKTEIQKPDDQCDPLVYDIYSKTICGYKPREVENLSALERGIKLKSAEATNLRGVCYTKGIGSEPDLDAAYQLYTSAASLGSIDACFNLGNIYLKGKGRAKNYIAAKTYFKRCQQVNHPHAIIRLAEMNLKGDGFKKNFAEAANLFREGAQIAGKSVLASIAAAINPYITGIISGFSQLDKNLIKIITIAAELEYPEAINWFGLFYSDLQQYDIARTYFAKAAPFIPVGYANVAKTYVHLENPTMDDLQMALANFELALANNHLSTFKSLALMYERPEFGPNYAKAIDYLERGIQLNIIECIERRAYYHIQGLGGGVDLTAAAALYERGVALNNALCKSNLAKMRLTNLITSITEKRAYALLEEAVASGYVYACAFLAGKINNVDRAAFLFRKALHLKPKSKKFKNALRKIATDEVSPIVQYHWFMTLSVRLQRAAIIFFNHLYPCKIVNLILNDEFLTVDNRLNLLKTFPGHERVLRHILELGIHHPTRTCLISLAMQHYAELDKQEFYSDMYTELDNIKITRMPRCHTYLPDTSSLRAYLQMTLLFEALINNAINQCEILSALKMLCDFHHDILEQASHSIAEFRLSSMMFMANYWRLFLAHLQLVEVYANELRNILLPHQACFTQRQKLAIHSDRGILSLVDSLLQAKHYKKQPANFKSMLIAAIQTIKLPALYNDINAKQANLSPADKKNHDEYKLAQLITKFGIKTVDDHQQTSIAILADTEIIKGFCLDRRHG